MRCSIFMISTTATVSLSWTSSPTATGMDATMHAVGASPLELVVIGPTWSASTCLACERQTGNGFVYNMADGDPTERIRFVVAKALDDTLDFRSDHLLDPATDDTIDTLGRR